MAKKRKTQADYEREWAAEDAQRASQFQVPARLPASAFRVAVPRTREDFAVPSRVRAPEESTSPSELATVLASAARGLPQGIVDTGELANRFGQFVGEQAALGLKDRFAGGDEAYQHFVNNPGVQSFVTNFTEHPVSAAADFLPLVGAAKGPGEMARQAVLARRHGDIQGAQQLESALIPLAVLGMLPEGGALAKGAERSALREGAENVAKEGASDLAARRTAESAGRTSNRPNFDEGFGTFKSGPTKVIWENNKDGTVEVISLRTPAAKRGQGAGRAAMQDFLSEADRQGLDVKLGASPLDKRTKLNKLVDFYKSLGFETTGKSINMAGEPEMVRRAAPPETPAKKSLAVNTKVKASAKATEAPNPTKVIAEEYSPETARRVRDNVGPDAPIDEWRAVADRLHGTSGNRPYQPENDIAFRDFDLGTYGMRKTIDAPRLYDLDVGRERWSQEPEKNTLQYEDIVGRPIMTGMSDRTPSGTTITRIGPTELDIPIYEHGGQDYMLDHPYSWGVSTKTMGSNFMNTARRLKREFGVNPIWMPWRMAGSGSDFSKTTGETLMSYANSALGADTRGAMDRFIRENYIPDFAGIDNPRGYLQFGELAGPRRKAMEEALSTHFSGEGGLSLPLTRAIITDPNQLDRKSFFLQNVAEIDPDAEVVVEPRNPTYHYNTPGAYKGTLSPELQNSLNVAELIAPTLNAKYSGLNDLSVFRGQKAPLSPEELARQQAEYSDKLAQYNARRDAGDLAVKPPREPVPMGNTNKFMQSVFATGFLDDAAAKALYDKLVAAGANIK